MSQSDFGTIDPNTKNGTELASDLNSFRDALHTSHLGSSRPSYAVAGMIWIDNAGAPSWTIKTFDGSDDLTLFTLNIDTDVVGASFSTIALTDAGTTTSLSVTRTGAPPTVNIAFIEDQAAANNFSNLELKAHRPGIIFRDSTASADDFRIGLDGNILKISIDTDDDDARDATGHFTDVPNALSLSAAGFLGLGIEALTLIHAATSDAATAVTLERVDTSIAADDVIGQLLFKGGETTLANVAQIQSEADAAWAADDSATRISMYTTPSGSTVSVERVRIDATGQLGIFSSAATPGTLVGTIHAKVLNAASVLVLEREDTTMTATDIIAF